MEQRPMKKKQEAITWFGIAMTPDIKQLIKQFTYTKGKFSKKKAIKSLTILLLRTKFS